MSLGLFRFNKEADAIVTVSTDRAEGPLIADAVQFIPQTSRAGRKPSEADVRQRRKQQKELASLQSSSRTMQDALKRLTASPPPSPPMVMSVREEDSSEDSRLHVRANVHNLGAPSRVDF